MATFIYHYIDGAGHNRLARVEAANMPACRQNLQASGVCPVFVCGPLSVELFSGRKLRRRALVLVFRQLEAALDGGVPLLEALHFTRQEQDSEKMRRFLQALESGVLAGQSFSEALRSSGKVDEMLCQWIAIGEQRGELAAVLGEVAAYMERREKLSKRMQQQLIYPLVVLLSVLTVGAFLTLVVMPILAEQFFSSQEEMPHLMRFFLMWHDILGGGGIWLFLLLALAIVGAVVAVHRSHASRMRSLLRAGVLRMRFLRRLVILRIYVPFARLSGQLLRAGIGAGEVFLQMRRYFEHSLFAADFAKLEQALAKGVPLTVAMGELPFVPPMARQMLAGGERYGNLAESLLQSADYYEERLVDELALWLRFAEPIAIVLLGLLVLMLALGLFVPILDSYQILLAQ